MSRRKKVIVWDVLIGWLIYGLGMGVMLSKIVGEFYQALFMVKGF